jgi:hypothetical protein
VRIWAARPGAQTADNGDPARRQRRRDTQDRDRVRRTEQAGHQGHERRLVGVPPRQVPAGGEEVQLVAVVPVPAREGHQQRNERGADRNDRAGGERHEVTFDGAPIRLGGEG